MKNIYHRKSVRDSRQRGAYFPSSRFLRGIASCYNHQLENITTFCYNNFYLEENKRTFQKHSQNNFCCKNNIFESLENFFLIQKHQKTIFQKKMQKKKEVELLQKKFSKRSFNFWWFCDSI